MQSMQYRSILIIALLCLPVTAAAQSDPAGFDTVINIGTPPPGSMFDITDADIPGTLITDTFFTGALGPNTQLNLFDGGEITAVQAGVQVSASTPGPFDENIEVNLFGGITTPRPLFASQTRIHAGATLNVFGGDFLNPGGGFDVTPGGTMNVFDGNVEVFTTIPNSTVNIYGGVVGGEESDPRPAELFFAGNVNISGGTINGEALLFALAETDISGGTINASIEGFGVGFVGTTLNVSGGVLTGPINMSVSNTLNVSGGSIEGPVQLNAGAIVNLIGTSFVLDSAELTNRTPAVPITDRDVTLSAVLLDGSHFGIDLNSTLADGEDFIGPNASLTSTLVPPPPARADVNDDGELDFLDIVDFLTIFDAATGG